MQETSNTTATPIKNRIKIVSIELIIILVAFLSSMLLIFFLVKEVFYSDTQRLDQNVFDFFAAYTSPGLTSFMKNFTLMGSQYFLIPANLLVIAYAFFIRRKTWFAIKTLSVALTSLLLMFGLKALFNRSRPLAPLLGQVPGLSFPSGHAFMSFTFFGLMIYLVYNRVKNVYARWILIVMLLLIIALIGISRIYLRVHYATDVMAGFSLGTIWLILSLWGLGIIEKHKTKLPAVH